MSSVLSRFVARLAGALAAALVVALPALAGPTYLTDDPQPTDQGHWEIYNFAIGSHDAGGLDGEAGFDINYGAAKDLQLTVVIPADFIQARGGTQIGLGDIELAAKYRFLHQADGQLTPDVAFFPRLFAPTPDRRFGEGRATLFLPLWAQKDFGRWSVFGGGGYDINPGPGQRNYWLSGVALQRAISDRLSLGAEIYHQTAEADDAKPFTGINLGATYKLAAHWSLLAAGGPGIENPDAGGRYAVYVALKADY